MKRGSYMSNFGSKGQRSTFRQSLWVHLFQTGYLNTHWLVVLPTSYTDSGWWMKDAQKVLGQTVIWLINVSKGRCPKALDDFDVDDSSVLSQCALRVLFVTNFLWFFVVLEYSLSTVLFSHLHNTRKKRYRGGRANRSNRPTKVSLYWTGFTFGFCPQKHRAQLLKDAKRSCYRIL